MWGGKKKDTDADASAAEAAGAVPVPQDVPPPSGDGGEPIDVEAVRQAILEVLRTIYDPEIPVNIYEIGLIYGLDVAPDGRVNVRMTLTTPMCPAAESLPPEVEAKVGAVRGVRDVVVDLVWDPPWTPAMMSEDARLLLNIQF